MIEFLWVSASCHFNANIRPPVARDCLVSKQKKAAVVSECDRTSAPSPVTPPEWDVVPSHPSCGTLPIDWLNTAIIMSFDTGFPSGHPLSVQGRFHSASPVV
jgi:hypothetical protein